MRVLKGIACALTASGLAAAWPGLATAQPPGGGAPGAESTFTDLIADARRSTARGLAEADGLLADLARLQAKRDGLNHQIARESCAEAKVYQDLVRFEAAELRRASERDDAVFCADATDERCAAARRDRRLAEGLLDDLEAYRARCAPEGGI